MTALALGTSQRATGSLRLGFFQRWAVLLGVVLVWQLVTMAVDSPFFPPPLRILTDGWRIWFDGPVSQVFLSDFAVDNLVPSVLRMLTAWAAAALVGVLGGLALGRSRTVLEYVGPIFAFARAIPPPILVPVFMVIFGLGAPMQVATIVFGVIWPVLLNTVDGARSVEDTQVATARVFRLPPGQWFFGVVLPAASPKIFAGLRVSLSLSLILMVISELAGATNGVGFQLTQAQQGFDYIMMWTIVVLLGVLGYLMNTVLMIVERRVLAWQPRTGRESGA